jgi:hypothetical protein
MRSRLSDRLLADGVIGADALRTAQARQAVYGGALDTALLELGALDEARLWRALGEATGLPVPGSALLEQAPRYVSPAGARLILDEVWSERCRAVPVGVDSGAPVLLCGEPVAEGELQAAAAALGVSFSLFIAPEVRLAAARQVVFGRPMPPRLVKLLARVLGTPSARRWQATHAKRVVVQERVGVEILEPRKPGAPAAAAAAPTAARPARNLAEAAAAATADARARIPGLIARVGDSAAGRAAQAELVKLTARDLGAKPRRWQAWWEKHRDDDRAEWLFEGLGHKTPEIRAAAEEALRALSGEYFGYHFDLPRAEREDARLRWQTWWYEFLAGSRG